MIWISHLLEAEEMKNLLGQIDAGVESIAFSIAENLDHLEQTLQEYAVSLEQMGCRRLTLHGPFLDLNPAAFDERIVQVTMERYEQVYTAAEKLGAEKVIFHSGFLPSVYFLEGWPERMAAFYNRFLEGKSDRIQVLMENVLDPYPEPILETANLILHPAFGVCLDVGHANCYSKVSVQEWAKVLKPKLRHLHIHDNAGDRDTHLALGEGCVCWEKLRQTLGNLDSTIECCTQEAVQQTYRILEQIRKKEER